MAILLALLGFIVAGDVVGLEPVTASPANTYGCNALLTVEDCDGDPYCYWAAGADAGKRCIDDPCLDYYDPTVGCPANVVVDSNVGVVDCAQRDLTGVANHDCTGTSSGSVCAQKNKDKTLLYTYCEYTQLKDKSCPDSICMKSLNAAPVEKHCIENNVKQSADYPCIGLSETDCKLIPKCLWNSSTKCGVDFCFQKRPTSSTCAGLVGNDLWGASVTFANGSCVDWKPYGSADGTLLDYCINKNNADANICYFGNKNISSTTNTDFPYDWAEKWTSTTNPGTYPTYNYKTGSNLADPVCDAAALPNCEGRGECVTIVNQRGALAGKYCTDGKHAAANILRIPSLIVLAVSLVAMLAF